MNENKRMKQIEILAPAGGMESLIAGVRCGADAVYLGGEAFSARRNAGNFDNEALKEAVSYCHIRGVKVYLAVNTLVGDKELEQALFAVQDGLNAGVDALIVQDIGLAALIHKFFPSARLHASTQMSVMSPEGFRALAAMGFVRAVVPREMSRDEIRQLALAVPDMELEAFVHGALCMCVSGQCYMSAMLGSRSGNRGLCAQPCRLPFYVEEKGRCDLSLKDLSLVQKMDEMAEAGVTSFKIEGRMKRPEYVAAAVTACREGRSGNLGVKTFSALKSVFSRSGFTDGYFMGKLGKDMFGTRMKEDVVSAKDVLGSLARLYQKETPLVPVRFHFQMSGGTPASLTAECRGKKVTAVSETLPDKAVNKPLTAESVSQRLNKCGGTPFYIEKIDVFLEEALILPAAELNGLRRSVLEQLSEELAALPGKQYDYQGFLLEKAVPRNMEKPFQWRGVFDSFAQVPDNISRLNMAFLPLNEKAEHFQELAERCAVGAVLPRGMFGNESEIRDKLKKLKQAGVQHVLTGNLGGVKLAKALGFTAHGDFGLNVFNSQSLAVTEKLGVKSQTLSFELTAQQIALIHGGETGVLFYGRLPLMLTKNCPVQNELTCAQCGRSACLTDRKGIKFPVRCGYGCSEILNSRPVYLADRRREFPVEFGTLLFTTETREEAAVVMERCLAGEPPFGEYTRGLAYRGVE